MVARDAGPTRVRKGRRRAAVLAAVLVMSLLPAPSVTGSDGIVYDGDSAYELITDESLSTRNFWVAAIRALFQTAPGCSWSHLVTVTSQGEQDIVAGLMAQSESTGAWMGGFQRRSELVADQGWRWVTFVPWRYTSWASGEPNDVNLENVVEPGFEQYLEALPGDGAWNDVPNPDPVGDPKYFIVESEGCD